MQKPNVDATAASIPGNITSFDKPAIRALRPQIDAALALVAKETGLVIKLGACSFFEGQADFKLSVTLPGGKTKDAASLEANAQFLGLPADALGRVLKLRDGEFRITGLRRSRLTLVRVSDGKDGFLFPVDSAVRMFQISAVA